VLQDADSLLERGPGGVAVAAVPGSGERRGIRRGELDRGVDRRPGYAWGPAGRDDEARRGETREMVCGVVELYSRLMPVIWCPFGWVASMWLSKTVAESGCGLLRPTLMVLWPSWPTALRTMLAGGQVAKKPALEAVLELEMVAVMVEEPGWLAVANPLVSMVTTLALPCAAKVRWPTWQVMLCALSMTPPK